MNAITLLFLTLLVVLCQGISLFLSFLVLKIELGEIGRQMATLRCTFSANRSFEKLTKLNNVKLRGDKKYRNRSVGR